MIRDAIEKTYLTKNLALLREGVLSILGTVPVGRAAHTSVEDVPAALPVLGIAPPAAP